MTDTSLAAPSFAEREFRVGSAISAAITVLSRNLLPFCIVTAIASLPTVLAFSLVGYPSPPAWLFGRHALSIVLGALSQAILLYASLEDIRGRPVDLMASFGHAWRRFVPLIGTAFLTVLLGGLALLLLVVPALILLTMWYVAIPACVVEQTGPWMSLSRSAALTKGNRWKVFGMMTLVILISGIGAALIGALAKAAGATVGLLAALILIWNAPVSAFSAVLAVVTYHDLRVAKEGVNTDRIAAVFE
jgi:hypothetical protein